MAEENGTHLEPGVTGRTAELMLGMTISLYRWFLVLGTLDALDPFRARASLLALLMVSNLIDIITRAGVTAVHAEGARLRNLRRMDDGRDRGSGTVQLRTLRVRRQTLEMSVRSAKETSLGIVFHVPGNYAMTIEADIAAMVQRLTARPDANSRYLALRNALTELRTTLAADLDSYFGFFDLNYTLRDNVQRGVTEDWTVLEDELRELEAAMNCHDEIMTNLEPKLESYKMSNYYYLDSLADVLKHPDVENLDPHDLGRVIPKRDKKRKGRKKPQPKAISVEDELKILRKHFHGEDDRESD